MLFRVSHIDKAPHIELPKCLIPLYQHFSVTSARERARVKNSHYKKKSKRSTKAASMTSLKRTQRSDQAALNISNKVYVRSTRNGKVQKIVREVYLRTDIPCSSNLCRTCLSQAPRNAANQGENGFFICQVSSLMRRRKANSL